MYSIHSTTTATVDIDGKQLLSSPVPTTVKKGFLNV